MRLHVPQIAVHLGSSDSRGLATVCWRASIIHKSEAGKEKFLGINIGLEFDLGSFQHRSSYADTG